MASASFILFICQNHQNINIFMIKMNKKGALLSFDEIKKKKVASSVFWEMKIKNKILPATVVFKKKSGLRNACLLPPRFFNIVIASVRLSVRPSRYLLLNHWTKSNQIWCVSCSHEWGVQWHIFFLPRPLGPRGGAKRSNIIKYH